MTEPDTIRYSVADGIATIELTRPDKRNAIDERMFGLLGDAAESARDDDGVRGVLVAGEGPSFCAGIDLELLASLGGIGRDELHAFISRAQRPFLLLATMPKPVVAAVQGHALGAGCQLALAADIRLAAEDASFAIMEPRYGIIPDLGGPHRLERAVGPAFAKEMVWSTRSVGAEGARRRGLVSHVVGVDELRAEAERLLRAFVAHSPTVLALTKILIDGAPQTSLQEEMAREARAQVLAISGATAGDATDELLQREPSR